MTLKPSTASKPKYPALLVVGVVAGVALSQLSCQTQKSDAPEKSTQLPRRLGGYVPQAEADRILGKLPNHKR